METRRVLRLDYPETVVSRPIVSQLIREFDLVVNILRAEVSEETGWLVVEVRGSSEACSRAVEWLREQGLQVTESPPLNATRPSDPGPH